MPTTSRAPARRADSTPLAMAVTTATVRTSAPASPARPPPPREARAPGHVPHVVETEPQEGGQDQVRPGETSGCIVSAQDQVRALPPAEAFHDQAQRGAGEAGQQAHLDTRGGELG